MNRTKNTIGWCDLSWNPITGCKHGCWYCYAKKLATRGFIKNNFEPTFYPERLKEPWELKKPSKIFCCSVSDLFAPWTPQLWREQVFDSMLFCPVKHIFQTLTKNPENIPKNVIYPNNFWFGTTVTCDNDCRNIEEIKKVKASVRFASFEPLLGSLPHFVNLKGLDWIIIGKLTGSKKVTLKREWVTDIIHECLDYDIPIFMKNNLCPIFEKNELIQQFPKLEGVAEV